MEQQKRSRRRQTESFETFAYLLMTLCIIIFILGFINDRMELLAVLLAALLVVSVILLLFYLQERRVASKYRELRRWMKSGDVTDTQALSPELQEEWEEFFREIEKQYSYDAVQADMEFAALQNQINPHFLYNTLDAIRSQAIQAGAEEIADMTGKLSRFFRYSIKNRGDLVRLAEELHNVEDYFSIQRYRFEDRFAMEIFCPDESALLYYLPKMTFQPIVENALYHGLEPKKEGGTIRIGVELQEKSMVIRISDDGVGMEEAVLEKLNARLEGRAPEEDEKGKRNGIAIYNVNKRLRLLFGDPFGLSYHSVPGIGTDVEVRVPLVNEENRGEYLPQKTIR